MAIGLAAKNYCNLVVEIGGKGYPVNDIVAPKELKRAEIAL